MGISNGFIQLMLALVSAFFVLVTLGFLNRKLLKLWYITAVYGRYSYEFLNFFSMNKLRNPFNGCIKDEIPVHLEVFFRKTRNSEEFQTEVPIDYPDVPFMSEKRSLFRIKGKPDCLKVAFADGIRFIIMGYHEKLMGCRMRSIFYFVNDRFVMGEILFTDLTRVSPVKLAETLSAKYLKGKLINLDTFYIKNTGGNHLNFDYNGFTISVKYLYRGDPATNRILETVFNKAEIPGARLTGIPDSGELLDRF